MMKIYRVEWRHVTECSKGFEYYSSLKQARTESDAYKKELEGNEAPIQIIEFRLSKKEVVRLLRRFGSHNDNG